MTDPVTKGFRRLREALTGRGAFRTESHGLVTTDVLKREREYLASHPFPKDLGPAVAARISQPKETTDGE